MSNDAANVRGGAPRTVTIRLRLPVFITALALVLLGLVWIFVLGILVGRGYNTREHIGPLAVFVPGPPSAEATGSMNPTALRPPAGPDSTGNTGSSGDRGQNAPDAGELDALFQGGLLRSEDLDFQESLKTPEPVVSTASTAAGATQSGTAPQAVSGPGTPAPAGSTRTGSEPADDTVYEFIYQVSAYNQLHQAQNLAQKLNGGGITSQIELHKTSSATWYRVLVSFKGKEAEVQNFQQRLKPFNLNSPMLRKKKAISG